MLQVVWHGNLFDVTGYAKASRQHVLALHNAGVNVKARDSQNRMPTVELPDDQKHILLHVNSKRELARHRIHIMHSIPDVWRRKLSPTIGFTYWETSKLPEAWVRSANRMNAVFLPSMNNIEVFQQSGVQVPLFRVRPCLHRIPQPAAAEHTPSYLNQLPPFRFLAVCSWIERKGIDLLLEAFWREFSASDPVALIIKTTGTADIHHSLEHYKHKFGIQHASAPVYVDLHTRSEYEMDAIYRNCHAFVHTSRGEGVGYPILEAAFQGLPIITTGWGGQLDYLNAANSYLIPYQLVPVKPQPYYYGYQSDQLWAECSVSDIQRLMREVLTDYHTAQAKALAAQHNVMHHFSPAATVQDIAGAIYALTEKRIMP